MNSDDIDKDIKAFLEKGGRIKRIPGGLSTERPLSEKTKLFGLTSRNKSGFHKERLVLNPEGDEKK
tara:strand:- start:159 stop:356 length:198 start_codon:yes stop_codon:yes gene_type:complete